jgi:hypothetical protein
MTLDAADVLVRAADAGDTYLAWRWLDALDDPRATRLDAATVDAAVSQLDSALIAKLSDDELPADAAKRAMQEGALTSLAGEQALASTLADAILPPRLIEDILAKAAEGRRPRLRLTPSPRLARVPWEILRIGDGDDRLLEVVDVVYDPPATVRAERSTPARKWHENAHHPGLFIIDPSTPGHPDAKPVVSFDTDAIDEVLEQITGHVNSGGLCPASASCGRGDNDTHGTGCRKR